MEEEITYIPYGQDQISQQELLTNMANDVQNYVDGRAWSKKRKESFLRAYQDIVSKGITGASNNTGVWQINHNGTIDMSNMSQIDKEMYGAAAYFIQNQMSKIKPKIKEEEKKQKLEPFDHNTLFNKYIINNQFGGNKNVNLAEQWDYLDDRDATGKRGTKERRNRMIKILEGYRDSIEDNKYSFENTPFEDINDFRTRINNAITALGTDDNEKDDIEAFNKLGLNSRQWFSNGLGDYSGETYTDENGNVVQLTYDQLNQYNDALNKKKQEQLLAEQKAKQQAAAKREAELKANRFNQGIYLSGGEYTSEQDLFKRYSNTNNLIAKLNQLGEKSSGWSDQERLDIAGAFNLYKNNLQNISKEELDQFKGLKDFQNIAPNRIKRIPGVSNFYYDTKTGKIIRPGRKEAGDSSILPEFNNMQENYLNSTEGGFTPEERNEVIALLFDLGAAADPEGFSSAALSQIAAGFRDYNRKNDPEGWTLSDTGWATLDHGLGLLSLIPVAGGWIKGAWAASKLGKYIPKIERTIRLVGRAGSTYAMYENYQGALNTLNKIKNGEDLSLKDYQDLAYFFIGGLGHHQLNRGNRVERSAMKARGLETSNSVLNRAGITRTKAKSNVQEIVPTLKVTKTGEDGKVQTKEIKINDEQASILKSTKPSELNAKVKELKIENIPEGYEVAKPTANSSWSRAKINSTKNWFKRMVGRGNSSIFGTPITRTTNSTQLRTDEQFEQYLNEHNNTYLKKIFNGSNKDIRRYDRNLGNNNIQNQQSSNTVETPSEVTSKPGKLTKEEISEMRETLKEKHFGTNESIDANFKIDNLGNVQFVSGKDGSRQLKIILKDGTSIISESSRLDNVKLDNLRTLKENMRKINQQLPKEQRAKIDLELIRKLKEVGALKQGGRLDKQKIQRYKEFIKK